MCNHFTKGGIISFKDTTIGHLHKLYINDVRLVALAKASKRYHQATFMIKYFIYLMSVNPRNVTKKIQFDSANLEFTVLTAGCIVGQIIQFNSNSTNSQQQDKVQ